MVQAEEQKLQPQTRRRNIEQKRGQQAWKNVSEIRDIVKLKNNETHSSLNFQTEITNHQSFEDRWQV